MKGKCAGDATDGSSLSRSWRSLCKPYSGLSLVVEQYQRPLLHDAPSNCPQFGVNYFAHEVIGAAIPARHICPTILLAKEPTPDGLFQGFNAHLLLQLSYLPQALGACGNA
jgi:hypothetical protein